MSRRRCPRGIAALTPRTLNTCEIDAIAGFCAPSSPCSTGECHCRFTWVAAGAQAVVGPEESHRVCADARSFVWFMPATRPADRPTRWLAEALSQRGHGDVRPPQVHVGGVSNREVQEHHLRVLELA